jgi:mRNA interferase RelE/StbE
MNVKFDRSFEKDTDKAGDRKLLVKIADCIDSVRQAKCIDEIANLRKMKGAPFHYRIRIGNYRMGVVIHGKDVIFERFLHRKDVYKYFPKK